MLHRAQTSLALGLDSRCATTVDEANAVPEPASLVLFGTGMVGMAAALRRRKSRA